MKKLLGVMFVALLIAALLPVVASAEIVKSGTCGENGDNLTWTLDDEGTLIISGTGAMKDYSQSDYVPWRGEGVKNAVLEDGVTSIGSRAFSECVNLASVTIPDGVTTIGEHAFDVCRSLTSITIPDSVTTIGPGAFSGCWGLTSISIPKGVTSIGYMAFYCCLNLTSVTIPDSVTSIGAQAFYECSSLTSVTIPKGVTRLEGDIFCNCANLASVTLPKGLTAIEDYAFSACSKLMDVYYGGTEAEKGSLTIGSDNACLTNAQWHYAPAVVDSGTCGKNGDNLTWTLDEEGTLTISGTGEMKDYSQSNYAPWKGDGVKNAVIEDGVTSIGNHVFSNCSSLTSVTIPEGVTSIGGSAFYNCSNLTSVTIPDSVTSISDYAFSGCSSLMNVSIPDSVTSIADSAFRGCSSLTSVTIPEGVTSIAYSAFRGCSSLTSVTIPEGVTSIGGFAFFNCSAKRYAKMDSDGAKALGKAGYSFRVPETNYELKYVYDDSTITGIEISNVDKDAVSVTIPEGVTSIAGSAFQDCSSLTSVTIPESVTTIDVYAFSNCSSLTSVTIPEGVTSIAYSAFRGCSSLTSVTIPEGVTNIGDWAFSGCSAKRYANMDSDGAKALGKAGYSFRVPETNYELKYVYDDSTITGIEISNVDKDAVSVTIPEGVTSISDDAFSGCSSLTSVTIPEGVTSIGNEAFYNCSSLTSVTIPEGVTSIGNEAFYNCSSLTSVTIPEGVTSIGGSAFSGCSSLTSVTIPEGVTSIDNRAFYGCSSLTSVTIPEGVTSIGMWSFCNCSSLSSLTIPGSVTSIGGGAFCDSGLTSVTIPEGVTSIGGYAFSGCSAKRYANMNSDGAKALSQAGYSFRVPETNYELKYLYDDSTIIGIEISNVDKDAVSVTIPEGVTSIGNSAFEYCSSLTSISIPDSVTNIGNYAFRGCSSLTSISIPEGVKNIGDSAFAYSDSLSKILLPKSVESIGNSAIPRKTTIYCYEYTNADDWATENGYEHIVYIDGNMDDFRAVTLSCESLRLPIGEAKRVIADVFPAVKPGNIVWTSSDPAVASVEDGLITALAPGAAIITATAGKAAASVEVTVYTRATGFTIPEEVWFVAKDSVTLPVTDIQPDGAELVLTWKSADASLVQVDENGVVTSNRPDNDVTITATTDNGISRQCVAHACYPVTAVEFTEAQITLDAGHSAQLTANVTARTQSLVNKLVTFTSADEAVAKVDKNGNVTAMGPGTTTVTATAASGVSDSITVTVHGTLSLLRLPEGLEAIEDEAFMNLPCEAVIIPEGCTAIGARAFANCKALAYVRIPASVKTIAEDAFEGCDSVVIDRED